MFGDKEAYLEKFRTCVRTRPFPHQEFTKSFYELEHTKPLYKKQGILTVNNLYHYHTFMETYKILKLRSPISMYSKFTISDRKETTLITPFPTNEFVYRSTHIWNIVAPRLKVMDYSPKISLIKSSMKKALIKIQHAKNPIFWTSEDYNINKIQSVGII